jgi:pantoate--beta-alanine ligase
MKIISAVGPMRRLGLRWRAERVRVAFVPTMGCLHAGHLSLARRARREVGRAGRVVVSVYVNPAQFGPQEDFTRYPRTPGRDREACRKAGVDVLFTPTDAALYARGRRDGFSTYVTEERLATGMEGAARPGHFRGVTTVVAKLLNVVQPTVAVFGAKDFQQAAVVRRMVRDLNFPVRIVVAPTVREPDGLALSSRNQYLGREERAQAVVLWHALEWVRQSLRLARGPLPALALKAKLAALVNSQSRARLDYVEFFDPATLAPVERIRHGTHMALAVYVGATRLIDNAAL